MRYQENRIYHIYNQGNNKQPIFFQERNYHYFLEKMQTHLLPYADLICYCLMPNHFHWLVETRPEACMPSKIGIPYQKPSILWEEGEEMAFQQNLSNAIAILLRSYTRGINLQEGRSGSLFRRSTKSKDSWAEDGRVSKRKKKTLVFEYGNVYARQCFEYIHQNPVHAGLVTRAEDWPFSSARDYNGWKGKSLCNKKLGRKLL